MERGVGVMRRALLSRSDRASAFVDEHDQLVDRVGVLARGRLRPTAVQLSRVHKLCERRQLLDSGAVQACAVQMLKCPSELLVGLRLAPPTPAGTLDEAGGVRELPL